MKNPYYEYVKPDIDAGRLWRAKEYLQGNIGRAPFDVHLYEAYGRVLLQMGDTVEAGKYLFLSGERKPEYEEAIALFLHRYGRHGWHNLFASFPRRARNLQTEAFPEIVQNHLREMNYPPERGKSLPINPVEQNKWRDGCALVGCALFVLFILACTIAGFGVIVGWIRP